MEIPKILPVRELLPTVSDTITSEVAETALSPHISESGVALALPEVPISLSGMRTVPPYVGSVKRVPQYVVL
jgi:hypothetical protein